MSNEEQNGNFAKPMLGDVFSNPFKMPDEYKGKTTKNGGLTNFAPRQWTEKETDTNLCKRLEKYRKGLF